MEIERFTSSGQCLKPGVVVREHSNLQQPRFTFQTVLDSVSPDAWHGEVRLAGRLLVRTGLHDTQEQAWRQTESLSVDRIEALFNSVIPRGDDESTGASR